MAIDSDQIFDLFSLILELPEDCRWFELRCAYGELVTINCEYFPGYNEKIGEKGIKVLRHIDSRDSSQILELIKQAIEKKLKEEKDA